MTPDFYVAFTAWRTWAAVACAIFAVLWQVRAAKQLTSLQLFVQMRGEYESSNMQVKRAKIAQKLLADPKSLEVDDSVLLFFETLGDLTHRNFLHKDLVWTTFGYDVCFYWPALRHYVCHVRSKMSDNTAFCEFEKLHKKLSRHKGWEKAAPSSAITAPTPDSIKEFLTWESLRSDASIISQRPQLPSVQP